MIDNVLSLTIERVPIVSIFPTWNTDTYFMESRGEEAPLRLLVSPEPKSYLVLH